MISRRALLLALAAPPPGVSLVALDAVTGAVRESVRADVAPAPPGSVLKPFVLAALAREGIGGRRACSGELRIGGHRLDCSHGPLAVPPDGAEALAYSCNNWFAAMAGRLPRGHLAAELSRWGLGSAREGAAPALLALGIAGVVTTPLELARAYRRLALERRKDKTLEAVFRGLAGAAEYGTARLAAPPGLAVAGKTGTVGTPPVAWFSGYAPESDPRWVVVVQVRQGVGGTQAAPEARACFARLSASSSR